MKTNKLWMVDYRTGEVSEAQYPQPYDRSETAIVTDDRPTDEQAAAACAAGTGHGEAAEQLNGVAVTVGWENVRMPVWRVVPREGDDSCSPPAWPQDLIDHFWATVAEALRERHPKTPLWAVGAIDRLQRPLTEAAEESESNIFSVFTRRLTETEINYLRGDMLEGVTAALRGVKVYLSSAEYQRQYWKAWLPMRQEDTYVSGYGLDELRATVVKMLEGEESDD